MNSGKNTKLLILAASLGYFVDIYDLILFGIVKNQSLIDLGVNTPELLFSQGNFLLRAQMLGMLIGGVVWGILGDKRGRLSTLFLTILIYSLANIANGFVQTVEQYNWLRFIAGFGLAGELGVGVTLVSEVISKEKRGLSVSLVTGVGIAGSILAFVVSEWLSWRAAYWVGGVLGLLLLVLRVSVYESEMFSNIKVKGISRGNFFILFTSKTRFKKYLGCILIAVPTWYTVSVLAINSTSFANEALQIKGLVSAPFSVMLHYIGASIGSFLFGQLSQRFRSRKKVVFIAQAGILFFVSLFFLAHGLSNVIFYIIIFLMGIPMGGLWTLFITSSAEQFGTNIRSTVVTTAPNFVRGATILITLMLDFLKPLTGLWYAGVITGLIFIFIAMVSVFMLEESYHKDLEYLEE